MAVDIPPFDHEYRPGRLIYGPGAVGDLDSVCDDLEIDRPLVVTGRNVGANRDVMDPLLDGLGPRGDRLFAETTPQKDVETIRAGVERMVAEDVDGLVAVGAGSTIDVATVMCALAAEGPPLEDLFISRSEEGSLVAPDLAAPKVPIVAVPTTLAGADITCGAGLYTETGPLGSPDGKVSGGAIYGDDLVPAAVCYDPELLANTPADVLRTSAMNGFDHGIEVIYSRHATAITDATAARGLRLLQDALPALGSTPTAIETLGTAQVGTALTTYGLAPSPESSKIALVHAVGHVLARNYDVQQGAVHGVVAPAVLEYVFRNVDGRRGLLARALADYHVPATVGDERSAEHGSRERGAGQAAAVVEAVTRVRDKLGLPDTLRSIPELERDHLPTLAQAVVADDGASRGPPGLEPTAADIREVFERCW